MIARVCFALFCMVLASSVSLAAKRGELTLRVTDVKTGAPIAVRMHIRDAKGKIVKPEKSIAWHDHFVFDHELKLNLPAGDYSFEMERGLEYKNRTGTFTMYDDAVDSKELTLERFTNLADDGWYSGDLSVQRPAAELPLHLQAEDLRVIASTAWNAKGFREAVPFSDISALGGKEKRFYGATVGRDDREPTGGLFFLHSTAALDYTKASGEYPSSLAFLDQWKRQAGALAVAERANAWDLPAWLAAGRLDGITVASSDLLRDGAADKNISPMKKVRAIDPPGKPLDKFRHPGPTGNGRWAQEVYFHALNCGFRLPPLAASGSGTAANPVGYNRVYVHCESDFTYENWMQSWKAGRCFITNGPLMTPRVNDRLPGHVFHGEKGETLDLSISMNLATREKIEYLEVIKNGEVVHEVRLDKWAENNGVLPPVRFSESGWLAVRAVTNNASTYRFALSAPFYVEIDYRPRISRKSVKFFADWVLERAKRITAESPEAKEEIIAYHRAARDFWQALGEKANAE